MDCCRVACHMDGENDKVHVEKNECELIHTHIYIFNKSHLCGAVPEGVDLPPDAGQGLLPKHVRDEAVPERGLIMYMYGNFGSEVDRIESVAGEWIDLHQPTNHSFNAPGRSSPHSAQRPHRACTSPRSCHCSTGVYTYVSMPTYICICSFGGRVCVSGAAERGPRTTRAHTDIHIIFI